MPAAAGVPYGALTKGSLTKDRTKQERIHELRFSHAVNTLLKEFSADPKELTADDEKLDAEGVAKAQGHEELAKFLRPILEKAQSRLFIDAYSFKEVAERTTCAF